MLLQYDDRKCLTSEDTSNSVSFISVVHSILFMIVPRIYRPSTHVMLIDFFTHYGIIIVSIEYFLTYNKTQLHSVLASLLPTVHYNVILTGAYNDLDSLILSQFSSVVTPDKRTCYYNSMINKHERTHYVKH